jgi:chloramphenicol O-acetyltransferase
MNLLVNIDEINHYQVFYQDQSVVSARSSSHKMHGWRGHCSSQTMSFTTKIIYWFQFTMISHTNIQQTTAQPGRGSSNACVSIKLFVSLCAEASNSPVD